LLKILILRIQCFNDLICDTFASDFDFSALWFRISTMRSFISNADISIAFDPDILFFNIEITFRICLFDNIASDIRYCENPALKQKEQFPNFRTEYCSYIIASCIIVVL